MIKMVKYEYLVWLLNEDLEVINQVTEYLQRHTTLKHQPYSKQEFWSISEF